jgi:hypothetical protein
MLKEILSVKQKAVQDWAGKAITDKSMKEAGSIEATSETQGVLALFFAYIYGDACLDLDFPGFANYFRQHHDDL